MWGRSVQPGRRPERANGRKHLTGSSPGAEPARLPPAPAWTLPTAQAPPPGPPPLLSDTSLGQLVLASSGGMGWLSSTRQGLFTMADDLEQQ